jgi:hypothetical protein
MSAQRRLFGKVLSVGAALFACTVAEAAFEGVVHLKRTDPGGRKLAVLSVSTAGIRNDISVYDGQPAVTAKTTYLLKAKNPAVVYWIDHTAKAYAEVPRSGRPSSKPDLKVRKLKPESVAGFLCEHVVVTSPASELEFWTTKELVDPDLFTFELGPEFAVSEHVRDVLREAGADGFVIKSVGRRGGKIWSSMEMDSVEKPSLSPDFRSAEGLRQVEPGKAG